MVGAFGINCAQKWSYNGYCAGVKGPGDAVIPIWCHNSNLVIVSDVLCAKKLRFLGIYDKDGGHEAWLCYQETKYSVKLYLQPLLNYHQLDNVFDLDEKLAAPDGTANPWRLSSRCGHGDKRRLADHHGGWGYFYPHSSRSSNPSSR